MVENGRVGKSDCGRPALSSGQLLVDMIVIVKLASSYDPRKQVARGDR